MKSSLAERASTIRSSLINTTLLKEDNQPTLSLRRAFHARIDDKPIPQTTKASNIKWSTEDQQLIDWVLENFWTSSSTFFCKELLDFLQQKIADGPNSPEAVSGIFRNGFKFLQREIVENRINEAPMSAKATLRTLEK